MKHFTFIAFIVLFASLFQSLNGQNSPDYEKIIPKPGYKIFSPQGGTLKIELLGPDELLAEIFNKPAKWEIGTNVSWLEITHTSIAESNTGHYGRIKLICSSAKTTNTRAGRVFIKSAGGALVIVDIPIVQGKCETDKPRPPVLKGPADVCRYDLNSYQIKSLSKNSRIYKWNISDKQHKFADGWFTRYAGLPVDNSPFPGTIDIKLGEPFNLIEPGLHFPKPDSGYLTVQALNACGISEPSEVVQVKPTYGIYRPDDIIGRTCVSDHAKSYVYSVPSDPSVHTYQWTVPDGVTVLEGTGTDKIRVSMSNIVNGSKIKCVATNICGTSEPVEKRIYQSVPPAPAYISGEKELFRCEELTYSISRRRATKIQWEIQGGSIISGKNSSSVKVVFTDTIDTKLRAKLGNPCGWSEFTSINLDVSNPGPASIQGKDEIDNGESTIYEVDHDFYQDYSWTVTGGEIVKKLSDTKVKIRFDAPNGVVQCLISKCNQSFLLSKHVNVNVSYKPNLSQDKNYVHDDLFITP